MQTHAEAIVRDLSDEIAGILETYAKHGSADASDLPLSSRFFDTALTKLDWRIARTLGQDTARFYALLRDTATGCLNNAQDNLFYLIVSGEADAVQHYLHDGVQVAQFCEAMRGHDLVGRGSQLRLASYTLDLAGVAALTPGQIGRIGQQFYNPTARFGAFPGQMLPPSATANTLRVLIGKRARGANTEPDWFDGVYDPYREAEWDAASRYPRGTRDLAVQACRSWSDLAITVASWHVHNRLSDSPGIDAGPVDRETTRIEGFTHPDGDVIEITILQDARASLPILLPTKLVAHNRYGFHQLLLQIAPLHMDGEAIC